MDLETVRTRLREANWTRPISPIELFDELLGTDPERTKTKLTNLPDWTSTGVVVATLLGTRRGVGLSLYGEDDEHTR